MDLEQFKKDISNINHGTVIANVDMPNILVKTGDSGIITAYLPDMEKFAVAIDGKLFTFDCHEKRFNELFIVIK